MNEMKNIKKIIVILIMMWWNIVHSQYQNIDNSSRSDFNIPDNTETYANVDRIIKKLFSHIEKTAFKTNFNHSKVIDASDLSSFSGDLKIDTTINELLFKQIYAEIYASQIVSGFMPSLIELEMLMNDYVIKYRTIPLIVIDISYEELKVNSYEKGLITLRDTIVYASGNTSPIEKKYLFISFPFWSSCKECQLIYDDQFAFTNEDKSTLSKNITLNVGKRYYKSSEFSQITYSDLSLVNVFNVNKKSSFQIKHENNVYVKQGAEFPDPNLVVTLNDYGANKKDELGLWQGCQFNDNKIRKPILIIEGFDPFNARKFKIEDDDIAKCKYENHLYWTANNKGLADELREQGYDVLILNFANGSGELFNNSMVAIQAINYINQNKVTNNELIIIGPSMGGLIARTALAYMEHNNMEHYTKLYLSFDAPHQGANVCLGVQHSIRMLANSIWALPIPLNILAGQYVQDFKDKLLDAPATKQMLYYHHSQTGGLTAYNHPDFDLFQAGLTSLNAPHNGYPVKCKKIAIANGSSTGSKQSGVSEGQTLLLYIKPPLIPISPLKSSLYLKYNALPDNSFQNIITGYASLTFFNIPIALNAAVFSVNNTEPLDNVSAGTQVFHSKLLNKVLADPINFQFDPCELNSPIPSPFAIINDQNKDAFVPTISALDLQNTNDWSYDFFTNQMSKINNYGGYVFLDNAITPFDEVYVNMFNDPHVINSLDVQSASWAKNELGPLDLKLQNHTTRYDTDYEAVKTIEVGRQVTDELNYGDFIIGANTFTSFVAENSIEFFPGFIADNGTMLAYLDEIKCTIIKSTSNTEDFNLVQETTKQPANAIVNMILDNDLSSRINIYPNPTSGLFNIESSRGVFSSISIINIVGQEIFTSNVNSSKLIISSDSWQKGIYFCKLIVDGEVFINRLVVE
jgi:hypothetical protein